MPGSISKTKHRFSFNYDQHIHNMTTQQVAVKKQNGTTDGKSDEELYADTKHGLIVTHNRAHLSSGSHVSKRAYAGAMAATASYKSHVYFWYLPDGVTRDRAQGVVLDSTNAGWWINSSDAKGYPDPPFPYWGICGSYNTIYRSYDSQVINPMVPFYFIYCQDVTGQNWFNLTVSEIADRCSWEVVTPPTPPITTYYHDIKNFSYFPVIYVDEHNNKHAVLFAIAKNTVSYSNWGETGNIAGKSNYENLIQLFEGAGTLTDGTSTAPINAPNPYFTNGKTVNNSSVKWYVVDLNQSTTKWWGRAQGEPVQPSYKREKTSIYWPENYTFPQYGYPNN
jgi:hypothetical protein